MNDAVRSRAIRALALAAVIVAGFYVRIDSLQTWHDNKGRFYFAEQTTPLMLTADAYYYLDIAKQILADGFNPDDRRRRAPDGVLLNPTPPLISVVLAAVTRLTGLGLEQVAIILPTVFGALLGLPLYFAARELFSKIPASIPLAWLRKNRGSKSAHPAVWSGAADAAALAAVAVTLMAPRLVQRTAVGWFDTDGLNVLLSVTAVYCALKLFDKDTRARALSWFCAGSLNLLIFLWAWDQTQLGPLALGGGPLMIAICVRLWHEPTEWRLFLPFITLLFATLVAWKGVDIINPISKLVQAAGYLDYFQNTVDVQSPFPDSGRYVSEQFGLSVQTMAENVTGSLPVLVIAAIGLVALFYINPFAALSLLPLGIVAALAFDANRFVIFVAPLVGLGIGTGVFLIWWTSLWPSMKPLIWIIVVLVSTLNAVQITLQENTLSPRRTPDLFDAMIEVREKTAPNSLIWGSWGHGHALVHYTDRATVADGMYHPAELSYIINYPFTVRDYRLAANWIRFYAAHGLAGLHRVNATLGSSNDDWVTAMPRFQALLSAGPEAARLQLDSSGLEHSDTFLQFIFPVAAPPVILYLEHLHAYTDWFQAGAWDFATRSSPGGGAYVPLQGAQQVNGTILTAQSQSGPFKADLRSGQITLGNTQISLDRIDIGTRAGTQTLRFFNRSGLIARLNMQSRSGVMGTTAQTDALYSSLFYALTADQTYFKPVSLKPPYWGLWEVIGEAYVPPSDKDPDEQ